MRTNRKGERHEKRDESGFYYSFGDDRYAPPIDGEDPAFSWLDFTDQPEVHEVFSNGQVRQEEMNPDLVDLFKEVP